MVFDGVEGVCGGMVDEFIVVVVVEDEGVVWRVELVVGRVGSGEVVFGDVVVFCDVVAFWDVVVFDDVVVFCAEKVMGVSSGCK